MKRWILAGVLAAAAITTASAQDKPVLTEKPAAPQQTQSSSRGVPLKVQFVLARYQGEKRLSSMPYTLGVLTGTQRTSLRMGIQVPVATSIVKDTASFPSYNYRDVGTNIDCLAQDAGNGQYQLMITVAESSVHADAGDKDPKFVRDVPVFRNFNAQFSMILRDGQTMQYVSVTDPLNGEVMRVDVTLNLAK
jgi:hypothetical protein